MFNNLTFKGFKYKTIKIYNNEKKNEEYIINEKYKFIKLDNNLLINFKINNFNWTLYKSDSITNHLLKNELWEPHLIKFMNILLNKNFTSIDVGCCFGWHTLEMAKLSDNVYAFDPNDICTELLYKNVNNNNIHNVHIINKGLSNNIQEKFLLNAYEKDKLNIGDSFIFEDYNDTYTVSKNGKKLKLNNKKIKLDTIDNYFKDINIKENVFIKIDVQGYELFLLKGAENFIKKYKPYIAIEIEDECLKLQKTSSKELYDYIRSINYEIFFLDAPYPCDHICVHKELLIPFLKLFKNYIKEHTQENGISYNYQNGVKSKISII